MNLYARLGDVKRDMGGVTGTTMDATYLATIEATSRQFDTATGRHFYAYQGVRYFDGSTAAGPKLLLMDDLISVTEVAVAPYWDYAYATVLTENTDFWLGPSDAAQLGRPYTSLMLSSASAKLGAWPMPPRSIRITGMWGFSYELQAVGTLGAAVTTTSATSLTLTAGHGVQAGDTLVIGTEQMWCSAITSNTVTVTRGVNGTTAATHLINAAVSIRRYPRDVEMAVAERCEGLRWDTQSGFGGAATLTGDITGSYGQSTTRAAFARWRTAVENYSELVRRIG